MGPQRLGDDRCRGLKPEVAQRGGAHRRSRNANVADQFGEAVWMHGATGFAAGDVAQLIAMLDAAPAGLAGLRDRTLLRGFTVMDRGSEPTASPSGTCA